MSKVTALLDLVEVVDIFAKKNVEDAPAPAGGGGGGGAPVSGGQAAWNAGIRGSSVNNLGPIPSPVLGVVTTDKANIYKKHKKKKKHESIPSSRAEALMGLTKDIAMFDEDAFFAEASAAGLQVFDKGPSHTDAQRYTIAMKGNTGWNVYTIKDHHFGAKELELFFHTNKDFKNDRSWGDKVDYKKLPSDVKSIIMNKGFKGGI